MACHLLSKAERVDGDGEGLICHSHEHFDPFREGQGRDQAAEVWPDPDDGEAACGKLPPQPVLLLVSKEWGVDKKKMS